MGQWGLLSLEAGNAKILVGSPLKLPGATFQQLQQALHCKLLQGPGSQMRGKSSSAESPSIMLKNNLASPHSRQHDTVHSVR